MRSILAVWLAPFIISLCALVPQPLLASPEEALRVVEDWADAFSRSEVARIAALFADDALFMGTSSATVSVGSSDDIRNYFRRALTKDLPRGARFTTRSVMVLSDWAVLVTGTDELTGVKDGKSYSNNGRFTFVVAKRGDTWKIVHFHRSLVPAN